MNESERSAETAADAMLAFLKQREGDLISSKELRFALGPLKFREAVVVLRKRGIAIEATLGGSGNWGFRLPPKESTAQLLTEPAPSPVTAPPAPKQSFTVMAMIRAWEGYTNARPDGVVLPLSIKGTAAAVEEFRAAGLVVFYGMVDSPVLMLRHEQPLVEDFTRPRPDGLY